MLELWTKLKNIERTLLVVAVTLFTAAIVGLVYFGGSSTDTVPADEEIARVVESTEEIKRRLPMSYEFKTLDKGDIIGNGDTIYSGKNSKVLVKFLKGSRLVIGEQSLVVLREIDGKVDLNIEKGGVSGLMTEAEELEIKTEDDSLTINGEEASQFTVSYKPGLGLEVTSFDKEIKLDYKGEQVSMKAKKALVSSKKGIELKETFKIQDGREKRTVAAEDVPPKMPEGVSLNEAKTEQERKISLGAPYPQENQVFLHTTGGQIPIFPKDQCVDGCELVLSLNGARAVVRNFDKNTVPLLFMDIQPNIQAKVEWSFRDGAEKRSGTFEIKINNETNFGGALRDRRPIEVVN